MRKLKSILQSTYAGIAAVGILCAASSASASFISVGGYDSFDISGLPGGDLGAAMLNPANHPTFGVSGFTDAGDVAFGSATASYLSGVDMFFYRPSRDNQFTVGKRYHQPREFRE